MQRSLILFLILAGCGGDDSLYRVRATVELSCRADFGVRALGSRTTRTCLVSNEGAVEVSVVAILIDQDEDAFSIVHAPTVIKAAAKEPLQLAFSPSSSHEFTATLTIDLDVAEAGLLPLSVELLGQGSGGDVPIDEPEPDPMHPLAGRWIGEGYTCVGLEPAELVEITVSESEVVATKLAGDRCVNTGEVTFRGTLSGAQINASITASYGPDSPARVPLPVTVQIYQDRLELTGSGQYIVFRRQL